MSTDRLLQSVLQTIRKYSLFAPGDSILVAVSGGLDSMVLLHLLLQMREESRITLGIAHCNFRLRGEESDEDERFVAAAAQREDVRLHVRSFDTEDLAQEQHLSIQEMARELRYAFFREIRKSHGYRLVATAHHADDNAETILLNLFRGAGVHGLSGIPVRNETEAAIRPLLFTPRSVIREYALRHGVSWREDSSNSKIDYTRNYLRHEILPRIRGHVNPNFEAALTRTSTLLASLESFLAVQRTALRRDLLTASGPDAAILDASAFLRQPEFLRADFLYALVKEFTGREPARGTVDGMLAVSLNETGTWCPVATGVIFTRDRDRLILQRREMREEFSFPVESERAYEFERFRFESSIVNKPGFSNDPYIEYIDADRVGTSWRLRCWKEGDWFVPLGMQEKRKVSDFFIDQKIPLFEKNRIPILESDGSIVWICGKRLDDRYKISAGTRRFLKLEYHPQ